MSHGLVVLCVVMGIAALKREIDTAETLKVMTQIVIDKLARYVKNVR